MRRIACMAEPKKKRQQAGKISPVSVSDVRKAQVESRRVAILFTALSASLGAVKFEGSIDAVGGRQLLPHLEAASKIGGDLLSYVYRRWPEAIPLPAGLADQIPESVPESGPNTRNGASESRNLSQPEDATKRKKTP